MKLDESLHVTNLDRIDVKMILRSNNKETAHFVKVFERENLHSIFLK